MMKRADLWQKSNFMKLLVDLLKSQIFQISTVGLDPTLHVCITLSV